jgi:DNA-binding NarL/FixJ family response regulator
MKYLVVDDHALIRDAMRGVLRDLDAQAVVLEAASGAAADASLAAHADVDLVLLDLHLPDADGMDVLTAIGRTRPGTAVVMLSGEIDQDRIQRALALGAQGYIPKSESREVLSRALALVLAGGVYVPPAAVAGLRRASNPAATPARADVALEPTPEALGLTERQLEVLALLMWARTTS